ncbi:MAG: hypothetical protein R3B06_24085 [Kofleriaceae bacterium]
MGLFDSGRAKARARQLGSLREELTKAGGQALEVVELDDTATATSTVGSTLKSLFGGRVTHDFHQVLHARTGGLTHLFVQPYEGVTAMPGEHHALLDGTLPVPAVFKARVIRGPHWVGGHGDHPWNNHGGLAAVTRDLAWKWSVGTTVIELPWTLQVRPAGGGRAHLVMATGRYGGFTTYHVGFAAFARVAHAVGAALIRGAEAPARDFVEPTQFGAPAAAALGAP